MNLKTFFSTFFVIQMFALSSFANIVTCNRISDDVDGFTTPDARDYWFPKVKEIDVQSFVEKGSGSKQMVSTSSGSSDAGLSQNETKWQLLPSGKMIANFKPSSGFMLVNRRYNCDKTSNEVRDLIATGQATSTEVSDGAQLSFPVKFRHTSGHSQLFVGGGNIFYSSKGKHFDRFVDYVNADTPINFGFGSFKDNCGEVRRDVKYTEADAKVVKIASKKGILLTNYTYVSGDFFKEEGGLKFSLFLKSRYSTAWHCSSAYSVEPSDRKKSFKQMRALLDVKPSVTAKKEVEKKTPPQKPSGLTLTKLDEAKSKCSDLGFAAGTEKHGDCVLKLMDY
jgi:hypothetical protein